jgi:hypothetical protein
MSEQCPGGSESVVGCNEYQMQMPPEIQVLDEPYQATWLDLNAQYAQGLAQDQKDSQGLNGSGKGPRSIDIPANVIAYVDHLSAMGVPIAHREL